MSEVIIVCSPIASNGVELTSQIRRSGKLSAALLCYVFALLAKLSPFKDSGFDFLEACFAKCLEFLIIAPPSRVC